ncbi:THUMP domain protein [Peptoniphilus sp. oral taxon 375 str. F0436]|nr:THUMP domain protein [Peptoniphilus sp. oral taxon 375 str. F0436]
MKKASIDFVEDYLKDHPSKTFKVESSRADKQFALKSPELNQLLGATILQNIQGLSVDVHHPDFYLYCDVKNMFTFILIK